MELVRSVDDYETYIQCLENMMRAQNYDENSIERILHATHSKAF